VILNLGTDTDVLGSMDLSGNMVRQVEQDMPVEDDNSHVINIGKMVEDMELKMRNLLREFSPSVSFSPLKLWEARMLE
jgi:capping protein (actin filament) muscle Z-line, beta